MVRHHIGIETWNKAISLELLNHLWSNPNVYDLMNSFAAAGANIADQFLSWLLQPGFPIVTLHIDSNNLVTATQRPISSKLSPSQLWWIPLYVRATNPSDPTKTVDFFMEFDTKAASYPLPPGNSWNLYGNFNYTAFLVVDYDQSAQFDAVVNQLSDPNFPAVDKQLLEDALFYLANHP